MERTSTTYQIDINKKIQRIIAFCASLIVVYNIVFIFIDNDQSIGHLLVLGIVAIANVILIFRNRKIELIQSNATLYIIINSFLFLPYTFFNGQGFHGFLPYFAIISCGLPLFIQQNKKGITSSIITAVIFSIMAIFYLFFKADGLIKNNIYQCVSFIVAMGFMIVFSRLFTLLYTSSLKKLKEIATFDYLTKVKNRRFMIDEVLIPREALVNKIGGRFSFALMDIDNFKNINDEFGHKYGDYALQAIGAALKCMVREIDEVARFGGDEFMILFDNIGVKETREIANRIRETVSELVIEGGIKVTISIGVVTIVKGHTSGYLRMADLCLIQAKEEGRNKVISYEIDFDKKRGSKYKSNKDNIEWNTNKL